MLHVVHKLERKQVKLIFVIYTNNIAFINNCPLFVSRSTWSKQKSTRQINQSVTQARQILQLEHAPGYNKNLNKIKIQIDIINK